MPAVLLDISIALVPIKEGVVGTFFKDVRDYRDQLATSSEEVVLANGIKIIGIEVLLPSDNNLIGHVKVFYDDSKNVEHWEPTLGKLNNRSISSVAVRAIDSQTPHKVAVMMLDSPAPVVDNIVKLLLA